MKNIIPGVFSNSQVQFVHSVVCENASDLSLWAKNRKMHSIKNTIVSDITDHAKLYFMFILICQNSIYCLGKFNKFFKGSYNFFVLSGIELKLLWIFLNMFYLNTIYYKCFI